jgi:hypothetical protein
VKTSPSDTSFQFLQDWQYADFGFDTTGEGWNARSVFHLFAMLERNVFGRNVFRIVDENLLTIEEEVALSNAGIDFDSTEIVCTYRPSQFGLGANRNNVLYQVMVCDEYTTCLEAGSGSECERQSQLNYGPFGCCLISVTQTICTNVWVDIPGSGGGSGGGTGGGGTGGGEGSGGGVNLPQCPNVANLNGRIETYDSCIVGWVPGPGSTFPEIINNVDDPCLRNSVNEAINLDCRNKIATFVNTVFSTSEQFHLQFHDNVLTGANANLEALTATGPLNSDPTQSMTIITLNNAQLSDASKEYIAITILHEVVHAWINYKFPVPVQNAQQHYLMAESYRFNMLRNALLEMYPNLSLEDATDLTWGGLYDTIQFSNLPLSERQRIIQKNSAYKNGTLGTPC